MLLPKTLLTIYSVWLLCSYHPSDALIVPQELPSLLSLVYSNIPPIKKGTDSRLGFGFRLGEHADFQVMLELGPQKETRPLGDQDSDMSFNKRHISKAEQNALIKQQLRQQLQQLQQQQESTSTERNAASWLTSWSQDMNAAKKKSSKLKSKQRETKKPSNEKGGLLPPLPVLPSQSLQQLQLLYKLATTTTAPATAEKGFSSTESVVSFDPRAMAERLKRKSQITKELMDVSLDGDE